MVVVFSLILFLLGVLAAESLIALKLPAARPYLDKILKYQEWIGLAGIILGGNFFIEWLDSVGQLRVAPAHFFVMLLAVGITLALGLLFGLEVVRRNLKDTSIAPFQKIDGLRTLALRFQMPLGVVGAVLGLITFFWHL